MRAHKKKKKKKKKLTIFYMKLSVLDISSLRGIHNTRVLPKMRSMNNSSFYNNIVSSTGNYR